MLNITPPHNAAIIELDDGGLHSVPGIIGGAVATGVKDSGDLDLTVIDAGMERTAAGVFTQNQLAAAPVRLSKKLLTERGAARTIVINSGNANALTGPQGEQDAREMIALVEEKIGGPAVVMSTGIIGMPLPMDKISSGIEAVSKRLSAEGLHDAALAIMTTDTRPKKSAIKVVLPASGDLPEETVTVGGIAKGSGMIHPNMATMLGLIATDADVEPGLADRLLKEAVECSFNSISVDGDTSTNDTVILLAGGVEMAPIAPDTARAEVLQYGISFVARQLALQIVADGEGMSRLATISVRGARNHIEAKRIAVSIACSSLVKTAIAGGDPNWGRILAAAANAGVALDPKKFRLCLGGIEVFGKGKPAPCDASSLAEVFSAKQVSIQLDLGFGSGHSEMITTDLTKSYVEINSEYTT